MPSTTYDSWFTMIYLLKMVIFHSYVTVYQRVHPGVTISWVGRLCWGLVRFPRESGAIGPLVFVPQLLMSGETDRGWTQVQWAQYQCYSEYYKCIIYIYAYHKRYITKTHIYIYIYIHIHIYIWCSVGHPPPPPTNGYGWTVSSGSSGPPPLWPVVVVWFFWSPPLWPVVVVWFFWSPPLWPVVVVCWYVGMLVCWYVCMYVWNVR